MRRLVSLLTSVLLIILWSSGSFADDRNKNIDKLSSFKSTGTAAGIVVPQEGKYMDNIKKNILPKIKMPAGSVRIKVSGDAHDYLKDAKRVQFDDRRFTIFSDYRPHGLFDARHYTYYLRPIDE